MILLENEFIKATFLQKGAELKSLYNKKTNLEYMWNGDPDLWAKTSPVLFPVVGALKDNTYFYQDHKYELSRHGFARDMDFTVEIINESEALFTLYNTKKTLINYPFEFHLGLRYKLSGNNLSCTYEVNNPGTGPLLFSVGGHPAFAVPLMEKEAYSDYFLQFNKDEQLVFHKIIDNLIDEETKIIKLKEGVLELKHSLFYEDALVFKTMKSNQISLLNTKSKRGIHFSFEDFPYFGIWAAKDANFICLEPWCGIADGIEHDQNLENKEGIIHLAPKSAWSRTWKVECF